MKEYSKTIFAFSLQFIYLIILSIGIIGCTTYYIPIESFKEQFRGVDSTDLKMVDAIGPLGERFSYPANTIDTIYCIDDNNKPFKLANSPSIEIRFTDMNDNRTIFYFDTVILQDSLIIGTESRFIPLFRDALNIKNIKLIEVQDGKKNFKYDKDK